MRQFKCYGVRLPRFLREPLFGKRELSKQERPTDDPDWSAWQKVFPEFYEAVQFAGAGRFVAFSGYSILSQVDLTGRTCLEIGPGILPHMPYWRSRPKRFDLVDTREVMLKASGDILAAQGVDHAAHLADGPQLPMPDASYDVLVSFYTLEHVFPLEEYMKEYERVLKPGGVFVGAIPSEGGLAWGLGRYCTTRRLVRSKYKLDYDKIIALEHCNTAEEILACLDRRFIRHSVQLRPLLLPFLDLNTTVRFMYRKLS